MCLAPAKTCEGANSFSYSPCYLLIQSDVLCPLPLTLPAPRAKRVKS